ncbi:MAG: hypothetical protein M1829_005246 [Trizodia sp. TS-e1964]|nr:MAG: hypothetical protein M1829_005246 [Trizodia sp. TS-e1964]
MGYLSTNVSDAVTFTLLALSTTTTLLRLYCRKFIARKVGLDDYLIAVAQCCGIVAAPCYHIKIISYSEFYYSLDLSKPIDLALYFSPVFVRMAPFAFAASLLYSAEIALVKLAIVAFYHRITPNRAHRYVLYFVAALILGFCLSHQLAFTFQLSPTAAIWNRTIKTAVQRFKVEDLTLANGIFQILSDVVLLLLPIPILSSLQCSRRVKTGLFFVFSLGTFATAASAMRLYRSIYLQKASIIEAAYAGPILQLWTDFETNTALICANLPALSTLFQYVRKQYKLKSASPTPPFGENAYGISGESKPVDPSTNNSTNENSLSEKSSGTTRITEFSLDVEANAAQNRPNKLASHAA